MKTIKHTSKQTKSDMDMVYKINGALAVLFILVFFNGTLLEIFNISTNHLFSEGNILILLLTFFITGIFISWYNERISGIFLLILALASLIYFIANEGFIEKWVLPVLIMVPVMVAGIYFLADDYKKRKIHH